MIMHLFANSALLAVLTVLPLAAADFSFTSILRAGARGSADPGWEIGTGSTAASITSGAQFSDGNIPGWSDSIDRQFSIGYTQATNTAYTIVKDLNGAETRVNFNPIGGVPLSSGATWSIRANLSADPSVRPDTSVQVSFVRFGNGLTVLQPLTTTPLIASQPTGASQAGTSAPIVFSAVGNSGNWYLDGVIRFSGLAPYAPNGASNSELQFALSAIASDTPEPAALILLSSGLLAMALYKRRRNGSFA
jgi:hypothetical protein